MNKYKHSLARKCTVSCSKKKTETNNTYDLIARQRDKQEVVSETEPKS